MKGFSLFLLTGMIVMAGFPGCCPSAEDILKKYDAYTEMAPEANRAGVRLSGQGSMGFIVEYDLPLLGTSEEYVKTLAGRWFVADAVNPGERLPARIGMTTTNTTVNGVHQGTTYGHIINCDSIESRYLLIGFEGIAPKESEDAATAPLFFLAGNGKNADLLTPYPRIAGDLISAAYQSVRFLPFEGRLLRKNVNGIVTEYTIRLGEIGHDEDGNLYIDYLCKDVKEGDWGDWDGMSFPHQDLGQVYYYGPMITEVAAGEKRFLPIRNFVAEGAGFRETYKTKLLPDTVIVHANNRNGLLQYFGENLIFDGKTKGLIRKESEPLD